MSRIRIGVIGLGKIATDQHLPAIHSNLCFELAATVHRSSEPSALNFSTHEAMLRSVELDAVAITTPPAPRYAIARDCIEAGLHLLLEKPPTATLAEIEDLRERAAARGVSLFTTWHAQHNPAVAAAASLLADQPIRTMRITWHEDVHKWHPGQRWIWEAGGFGVFDPGINAFSIATLIFPGPLFVREAALHFPDSSHTPIAADIRFASPDCDGPLECSLDWRRAAGEEWTISIITEAGLAIDLLEGGARLVVDGVVRETGGDGEYPDIYRRFAQLIGEGRSHVDLLPIGMVADCFLIGSRHAADPV
ncbi:MAG TPA: Gfo/Idh/MocA family oxidoreductase [Sphingomicrobium sp.]|nr:Gfo/Idh/MocA family oxidoreductase [Sphingomicrobium sp.]